MFRYFILLGLLCTASTAVVAKQNEQSDLDKQFFEHCESDSLTADQKHTLSALFKFNKVDSCVALHADLTDFEFQHIDNREIKDVTIFKYVSGLTRLSLNSNLIEDLSVLETLHNITMLSVRNNKISDIRPLLKMKSLNNIYLSGNPIIKESQYCPMDTHLLQINEFCFDEVQFHSDFEQKE